MVAKFNIAYNKLFYVVPKNLVTILEVPDYAGLYYVEDYTLMKVKEAPFIHREKLKFEEVLCHKFYHYWLNEKSKNIDLQSKIEGLEFEAEYKNREPQR